MTISYQTIVFLQGDDYPEFEKALNLGTGEAFEYLSQWESGDVGEIRNTAPWGAFDQTVNFPGYVMSWNPSLSYASLTKIRRTNKYSYLYVVQGLYGYGWEDLTASDSAVEARQDLKDYRANDPAPHRLITRRVPNS